MARSTPSLLALLGIAAVAGYQNRDRLGDLLGRPRDSRDPQDDGRRAADPARHDPAPQGGLAAGLRDLLDGFAAGGRREVAESWIARGPNRRVTNGDLEASLGPEVIGDLAARTGLDRAELLRRLTQALPETVDNLTPDGRLPD
jgi:uncharacterized protein YidB (DUF937 family)